MTPDIASLIGRLEKATGGSRVLDCEIRLIALGDTQYGWKRDPATGRLNGVPSMLSEYLEVYREVIDIDDALQEEVVPRYTSSIDAALQFVPETPHIASLKMERNAAEFGNAWHVSYRHQYFGHHAVLPIAIVISALRARAAGQDKRLALSVPSVGKDT